MKHLILHIGSDKTVLKNRIPKLLGLCNITSVTPEQAIFTIIDAQFAAAIVCHSVPKRKALTLVRFVRKVAPGLPIVLLRTGRERQPLVPADHYVLHADEPVALPQLLERMLGGVPEPVVRVKSILSERAEGDRQTLKAAS